jgi:lipoprotein signal peptidase
MTDVPIKNATNEKDAPVPIKIEITNGVSFGFLAAVGFWFFTLIFGILVILVLYLLGMPLSKTVI